MPRKIADGYLTVAQAAERLGVSAVWIYKLIEAGTLKPYRQGVTVVREADVQKLEIPEEINTDEK